MSDLNVTSTLLEQILGAERDFAKFIELREDDVFEAKGSAPYDFSKPDAQYELAKDVSSFANANGGWIIVGLTTKKLQTEPVDFVTALDLLAETAFPAVALAGRINDFIEPPIPSLDVRWIANAATPTLGLGVIRIPPQPNVLKPFLIKRVFEDGALVRGIVFGYAMRIGASSIPFTVKELRRAMQKGMSPDAERLTRIEEKLDEVLERGNVIEGVKGALASEYDTDSLRKRIEAANEG